MRFVDLYGSNGSVKSVLRSVNRISLVGLKIFSWQEWVFNVFRSVRTVRTDERSIWFAKSPLRSVKCARFTLAIIGSL